MIVSGGHKNDRRVRHVFILLAIGIIAVTGRIIYLQAIFPKYIHIDDSVSADDIYLPGYKVRAWEEKEDAKSKVRSAFSWVRKHLLTSAEEEVYQKRLGGRSKHYVHLMAYVKKEAMRTSHPMRKLLHERGRIYSSDGSLLAINQMVYDVALLKKNLPNDEQIRAKQIKQILDILEVDLGYKQNPKSLTIGQRLNSKKIKRVPITTATQEQYLKLKKLKLDALDFEPRFARMHPNDLAIDTLGIANYRENDRRNPFVGLSGLEKTFDEYLISREEEIDIQENPELIHIGTDEKAPRDLHITIDRNLQQAAQEIMHNWDKKIKPDIGLLLVQDCNTGKILALASSKRTPGQNYFTQTTYEPGSTLKTITFAALIDSKRASENEIIHVGAGKSEPWKLKRFYIRDEHDHPEERDLSLRRIIETSSNIGTGKFAMEKLSAEQFYSYLQAFGFGEQTGIELPEESKGKLHSLKTYKNDITLLVTTSYGHGIAVTPIQLLTAYSALVNGGLYRKPYLLDNITLRSGMPEVINEQEAPRRVISSETSAKVRNVLRSVMEKGTGKDVKIDGYILAGKTGTAMRVKNGVYSEGVNNALFAGFFPYHKPQYTILVIFERPEDKLYGFGARSALPAYAEMVQKIIDIKHIPRDF